MDTKWDTQGFLVVPSVFDSEKVAALRTTCLAIRDKFLACDPLTSQPGGDPRYETCMRHVNHPFYYRDGQGSLTDILETCAGENILDILRQCFNEEPVFRSTSLFFNPTLLHQEGNWHRDTQFIYKDVSDEREHLLNMALTGADEVQVQIPLVASDDLEYVPGSHHRWDDDHELWIRRADDEAHCREELPAGIRIAAAAGDVVVFDNNGIHRGRYFSDQERLTLMVSYTKASAPPKVDRFCYQPWFLDDGYLDHLSESATLFYRQFVDHYRAAWQQSAGSLGRLHSGRRSYTTCK